MKAALYQVEQSRLFIGNEQCLHTLTYFQISSHIDNMNDIFSLLRHILMFWPDGVMVIFKGGWKWEQNGLSLRFYILLLGLP